MKARRKKGVVRRSKPVTRLMLPTSVSSIEEPAKLLAAFRAIRRRISGRLKVRHLVQAGRRR